MKKVLLAVAIAATGLAGCATSPTSNGQTTYQIYQAMPGEGGTAHRCVFGDITECSGPFVFIDQSVDENMYDGKKVIVEHPVVIGSFTYTNKLGTQRTLPRIGNR